MGFLKYVQWHYEQYEQPVPAVKRGFPVHQPGKPQWGQGAGAMCELEDGSAKYAARTWARAGR